MFDMPEAEDVEILKEQVRSVLADRQVAMTQLTESRAALSACQKEVARLKADFEAAKSNIEARFRELANASVRSQPVTASGFDGHWTSRLIWYAQSLNRDHAWICTPQFPQACTPPPSPLLWAVPSSAEAMRR